jgi:hypothetical protein
MVGKTNMDQFASGLNGTRSPYGCPANAFDFRCGCAGRGACAGSRGAGQQLERPCQGRPGWPGSPAAAACPGLPCPAARTHPPTLRRPGRLPLPPGSSRAAPPLAPEPSWAWATLPSPSAPTPQARAACQPASTAASASSPPLAASAPWVRATAPLRATAWLRVGPLAWAGLWRAIPAPERRAVAGAERRLLGPQAWCPPAPRWTAFPSLRTT